MPSGPAHGRNVPVNLGPELNTAANEQRPTLSPDGLSLFFGSDRPGSTGTREHSDIYVSHRESRTTPWGPPRKVVSLSSDGDDNALTFSRDGLWVLFGSDRAGGCGGTDIWRSHRSDVNDDFSWEPPINLGCRINSPQDDDGPTWFEDPSGGTTLIFTSFNRPEAIAAGFGDWDIFESHGADLSTLGPAVLVPQLSSAMRDTRTAIGADGLELFLTSSRPGTLGGTDLWRSTRTRIGAAWSTPVNLGAPINSPVNDGAPTLSTDGRELYFDSVRPGGYGGRDLYLTSVH